jgi:hypothetical protein
MAEQKVAQVSKGTFADKLMQIIAQVEETQLNKRTVVTFDAEWGANLCRMLAGKYPELNKFTLGQIKGALPILLKEMTLDAVAKEGYSA